MTSELPSPKVLHYPHWFVETSTTTSGMTVWEAMWNVDSAALEKEFEARTGDTVYVENRRARVNLGENVWRPCYDDRPHRRVTRGTWFYYNSGIKKYQPFTEPVADKIESWFQGVKRMADEEITPFQSEVNMTVHFTPTPTKYRIIATKVSADEESKQPTDGLVEGFSITMKSQAVSDIFTGSITLQRGVEVSAVDEEKWCEFEVNHVFFVVHGIGQKFFAGTDSDFPHNVESLRTLMLNQHESFLSEEAAAVAAAAASAEGPGISSGKDSNTDHHGSGKPSSDGGRVPVAPAAGGICERGELNKAAASKIRMEVIGIEWYDLLRSDDLTLSSDLKRVTLPNLQVVRQIANEVVLDVLLYLTPAFRRRILSYVCQKINRLYHKFCEYNPTFESSGGKASLIGHSLGTVILFDLLSMQTGPGQHRDNLPDDLRLTFAPRNFFALGSPLGMFLSIRNSAHQAEINPIPLSLSRTSSDMDGTVAVSAADSPDNGTGGGTWTDSDGISALAAESGPVEGEFLSATLPATPAVPDIHKQFRFHTCSSFFNVFHPHDPVAYRMEPLLDPELFGKAPALVQHHDGGLRTVYKLKSLANQFSDTVNTVLNPSSWLKAVASKSIPVAAPQPMTLAYGPTAPSETAVNTAPGSDNGRNCSAASGLGSSAGADSRAADGNVHPFRLKRRLEQCPQEIPEIPLNAGRRVDFMLQENFIQGANEYLSSITSHTGYFEMKDVARFIVLVSTSS